MKSIKSAAIVALASGILSVSLTAGPTATQDVTFAVEAINELAISGAPNLVINVATAGEDPEPDTATGTYAITTNETGRKITAALDQAMPAGLTLQVDVAQPTGATSVPAVTLTVADADVVTGISTVSESGNAITYTLSATAEAGVVTEQTRTVTYTITAQ